MIRKKSLFEIRSIGTVNQKQIGGCASINFWGSVIAKTIHETAIKWCVSVVDGVARSTEGFWNNIRHDGSVKDLSCGTTVAMMSLVA